MVQGVGRASGSRGRESTSTGLEEMEENEYRH